MRSQPNDHPIHATPQQGGAFAASRARRRGSTIIVAVGVLAVLALVAVSYAVAVRSDRVSVASYQRSADLDSSARIVREEIGAILAADLFGNKIVTPDIPFQGTLGGSTIRVWPRMFEDGEFFDAPRTAPGTFDPRNPNNQRNVPSPNAPFVVAPDTTSIVGPFFPSAPERDDAWLSNTEPYNRFAPSPRDGAVSFDWTTWGQFSNMLSAYRWVRNGLNDNVGLWVRDDGRYADLGMFFLTDFARDPNRLRGDPGADLAFLDESDPNSIDEFTGQVNGPLVGLRETPAIGVSPVTFATDVLQLQIHELGELLGVGDPIMPEFNAFDERFFADTDGDLRADARWQSLDTLDGLLGLRWVVATRIIDNSALVNVNTAMEFQGSDPATQTLVGDGRTPADVDLTRLVRSAHLMPDLRTISPWEQSSTDPSVFLEIWGPTSGNSLYSNSRGIFGPSVDPNTVNPINEHLFTQLGLDGLTLAASVDQLAPVELVWSAEASITAANAVEAPSGDVLLGSPPGSNPAPPFTTRLHRYLTNRFFGVSPLQATVDQARPYPMTDEAELRAFFGVNSEGLISNVEQRFDHQRLDDSFGLLAGPLRAIEGIVPSGFPARNPAVNPTAAGESRPSIAAIAGDTRRLLTTVNGVADFSPVPVLNDLRVGTGSSTRVFDRPFNAKVRFRDVPRMSPQNADAIANQDKFAAEMRAKRTVVSDAFSAFAWALAPLAGHTPLMSPLGVEHTGPRLAATSLNEFAKYAYGGDRDTSRGPAFVLGGLMQASRPDLTQAETQPGAAYAMLRALSLAVNLADATDDERLVPQNLGNTPLPPEQRLAPSGTTLDLPTVARLYNIVHPTPDQIRGMPFPGLPPVTTTGDQVIRVGVAFPWGDLRDPAAPIPGGQPVPTANAQLMPVGHVGEPTNGVTLVGLDRQPFLVEVSTLAVYADSLALLDFPQPSDLSAADQRIDPTDPNERIGSIISWEVRNPWPEPIDIAQYRLALIRDDATYLTFNWTFADSVIPAGERVVYYGVQWEDGDPESFNLMDQYEDVWRTEMEGRFADPVNLRRIADDGDLGILDSTVNPPMLDVAVDPIPFQSWGTGSAVGLMMIDEGVIAGAGAIVVDRLSGNGGAQIPTVQTGAYDLTPATQSGERRTGILTVMGSVGRPTDSGAQGFPAWVIERRSANLGVSIDGSSSDRIIDEWIVSGGGPTGVGPDPGEVPSTQAQRALAEMPTLGENVKGPFPVTLPSFQLFVPNTELRYTSELLQLSAFTHMYVHDALDGTGATLGANIALSSRFGPGTWRTVSEQLGSDAELYRDTTVGGTGTIVNPYLGVLDPTRFVLSSPNAPGATQLGVLGPVQNIAPNKGLPEALAIPLALRVVDCFEALWTPDWRGGNRLVQGRVNINTATQKTLRMLPLVDPAAPIGPLSPQAQNAAADWRVPLIMAYRDRLGNAQIPATPREITGLLGTNLTPLRFVDPAVESGSFVSGVDYSRGFVTPGELVTLGRWRVGPDSGSPDPAVYNGRSFLELGANGANDSASDTAVPSIDVRRETYSPSDIQVRPTPLTGGSLDAFEGADDPEERLALYRAVSNIVTARSDVYSAYFTVRGYAPSDIEAVDQLDPTPGDIQIAGYMERLSPRFEARYLAVYDRSNVRTPVDRPRVLLFVRLPD